MKVGISNYYDSPNYGAFLLAFALKKKVEELGGDCYFIKIKKDKCSNLELFLRYFDLLKVSAKMFFSGKLLSLISSIRYKSAKERSFVGFLDFLELDKINEEAFDLVIIGSDVVFDVAGYTNFNLITQMKQNVDFTNAKKIISYAGSCAATTLQKIRQVNLEEPMRVALSKFHTISVRDRNTFEVVKEISGREPQIHVDPVFLYDFKDHLSVEFAEKDYILLYSYLYRITTEEKKQIMEYAKKKNKKIVSIGCSYDWCDEVVLPKTPFEILDYVKNADYVITDTFHGTIFSIKYNKNFCVIIASSNITRVDFLLELLHLEDRKIARDEIFKDMEGISKILNSCPDYSEANVLMEEEIKKATQYLGSFISYSDEDLLKV